MATSLAREALDQRAVQQPANHRDHEQEPDPEPRKVTTGNVPLLAELLIAGGQPSEAKDQPPKDDRTQPSARADHERHHDEPQPGAGQPRRHDSDRPAAGRRPGHRNYRLDREARGAVGSVGLSTLVRLNRAPGTILAAHLTPIGTVALPEGPRGMSALKCEFTVNTGSQQRHPRRVHDRTTRCPMAGD